MLAGFKILPFLAIAVPATYIDTVIKNANRDYLYDDRCDGLICDSFVCVPHAVICDGQSNCQDGTDEIFCPCPGGEFQCWSGGECVPLSALCDGAEDCEEGSDESLELCGEEGSGLDCEGREFRCDPDTCIRDSLVCDGVSHCDDGSDELDCEEPLPEPPAEDDLSFDDGAQSGSAPPAAFDLRLLSVISLGAMFRSRSLLFKKD